MQINSPEDVVEHMEKFEFPRQQESMAIFEEDKHVKEILSEEWKIQQQLGNGILKTGYGCIGFPTFYYFNYGYVSYFMVYALYPEVMQKHFSLQADYWLLNNCAAAPGISWDNIQTMVEGFKYYGENAVR